MPFIYIRYWKNWAEYKQEIYTIFNSGGSDDWAFGSGIFPYSYTIELPPRGYPGFELPESNIIPVGKEMYAGVAAMVSKLIKD